MTVATLVRRVLVEQRALLGIVGALILIDVALYALLVVPGERQIAQARARAVAAADRLGLNQAALAEAHAAMERKTRVDGELTAFYEEVLASDLPSARGMTYARISALARQAGLRLERRSSVTDQDEDSALGRLRTTVLLAGQYRDLRRFIYELERSAEFIVIDEVVLSQGEEVDGSLVLAVGLATYYRLTETRSET